MLPLICVPQDEVQFSNYFDSFGFSHINTGTLVQYTYDYDDHHQSAALDAILEAVEKKTKGKTIDMDAFLKICDEDLDEPKTAYLAAFVKYIDINGMNGKVQSGLWNHDDVTEVLNSDIAIPLIEEGMKIYNMERERYRKRLEEEIQRIEKILEENKQEDFEKENKQYLEKELRLSKSGLEVYHKTKGIVLKGFPQNLDHFNACKTIQGATKLVVAIEGSADALQSGYSELEAQGLLLKLPNPSSLIYAWSTMHRMLNENEVWQAIRGRGENEDALSELALYN